MVPYCIKCRRYGEDKKAIRVNLRTNPLPPSSMTTVRTHNRPIQHSCPQLQRMLRTNGKGCHIIILSRNEEKKQTKFPQNHTPSPPNATPNNLMPPTHNLISSRVPIIEQYNKSKRKMKNTRKKKTIYHSISAFNASTPT